MTAATRHKALVLALALLPFVLLFVAVRVAAPWLSRTQTAIVAGRGYTTFDVRGAAADYEVTANEERGRAAAEEAAQELDLLFVRMTEAVGEALGLEHPGRRRPVRLLLFERHEDLAGAVRFDMDRDFAYNAGYYNPRRQEIAVIRRPDGDLDREALRHEAAHLLVDINARAELRPWLSEGLAVLVERDDPRGGVEGGNPELLAVARAEAARHGGLSIPAIVGLPHDAFQQAGNTAAYAVSAALTAFLMDPAAPERRERFLVFVRDAMEGRPQHARALLERLAEPAELLEAELLAWLDREA